MYLGVRSWEKLDGLFLLFEQSGGKGITCQVVLCLSDFKVTEIGKVFRVNRVFNGVKSENYDLWNVSLKVIYDESNSEKKNHVFSLLGVSQRHVH